ncbi:MAG: hypothetical protein GXY52_01085 [Chloroflexi bacterium]|nr:hypothetical protein [Chloroflexota bacterium]
MRNTLVLLLLILAIALSGCGSAVTHTPKAFPPPPTATPERAANADATPRADTWEPQADDATLQRGNVFLDHVDLQVHETYPPKYFLVLEGSLPTPCHALRVVIPRPTGSGDLPIEVYAVRVRSGMCAQVLKPFSETIPLDMLPPGQYRVTLNHAPIGDILIETDRQNTLTKGWELYTWEDDGQLMYTLLPGTNRAKTLDELISSPRTTADLEQLKVTLSGFPAGETITWMQLDGGPMRLPDDATQQELADWCAERGLILQRTNL